MPKYYSASTRGFYDDAVHRKEQIPADASVVSDETHTALLDAQATGAVIAPDDSGIPFAAYVTPALESLRAQKLASVGSARDERARSSGFSVIVGGRRRWFHSDAASRMLHLGNKDAARDQLAAGGSMSDALLGGDGKPVSWKTMDGSRVTMTCQLAFDVVAAGRAFDAELFAAAEAHRAALSKSKDPAAYDFTGGWPSAFAA